MVEGYCADLAFAICHDKLNVSYKFLIETKYGGEAQGGVWDGIVGALTNRDADLAIASLTLTAARQKVVDFSVPFIQSGVSIMIRKPEKPKSVLFLSSSNAKRRATRCFLLTVGRVLLHEYRIQRSMDRRHHFLHSRPTSVMVCRSSFVERTKL